MITEPTIPPMVPSGDAASLHPYPCGHGRGPWRKVEGCLFCEGIAAERARILAALRARGGMVTIRGVPTDAADWLENHDAE